MNSHPDFVTEYARTNRFTIGRPRNFAVHGSTKSVLFLRAKSADAPGLCLWQQPYESGAPERLLVDVEQLTAAGELSEAEKARRERLRESGVGIVSYHVSGDGSLACFALGGELYLVGLNVDGVTIHTPVDSSTAEPSGSSEPSQLPESSGFTLGFGSTVRATEPTDVFDPRLSPDGSHVAYVSGRDLRVLNLGAIASTMAGAGKDTAVLGSNQDSGQNDVSYGRAEFVAAEEMGRMRGFWWSPTGDALLAARVDESAVQQWWISEPADPLAAPRAVRYPSAGTTNAEVRLIWTDGTERVEIDWSEAGEFEYLASVTWASAAPLIVRQTRDQQRVSVTSFDLETKDLSEQYRLSDTKWVDLVDGSPFLIRPDSASPNTADEQLGYVFDEVDSGGNRGRRLQLGETTISTGDVVIKSVHGCVGSTVVFSGWIEPSETQLFATNTKAGNTDGVITQLTDAPAVHAAKLSSDQHGTVVVLSAATTEALPTTTVHRLNANASGDSHELELLAEIGSLAGPPPIKPNATFVRLSQRRLPTAVILPESFEDHGTKLPVLLDPYGGPHAQRAVKSFDSLAVSQWFANQGFVVVITDGRGTPGCGPDWERAVYGDMANPVLEDQIDALDAAAEHYGFLDLDKVGIRGWSFGGYLAALAVLDRPDRIHAAIAGAPVTDWPLYDTHYTERYLGTPAQNPAAYSTSSLIERASKLERPLLLIHGLVDDNVVAAHTLQLSSALLAAGRLHQVLPLTGVTHMTPQRVIAENLLRIQLDFLRQHLVTDSTQSENLRPSQL